MKLNLSLDGLEGMREAVHSVTGKRLTKMLESGIKYAVTPIVSAARRNVRKNSGLSRKAIDKTVRVYASGTVVAVIGADYNVAQQVVLKGRTRPRFHRPAKLVHLLEKGHRIASYGRLDRKVSVLGKPVNLVSKGLHVGDVPAYPFLKPAFDQNIDMVQDRLGSKLRTAIARELSK